MEILLEILWGYLGTCLAGIATIALLIIAFRQIRVERRARRKSENNRLLALRRHQAERVAGWIADLQSDAQGYALWVAISNQSLQPIYHLAIHGIELANDGTPIGKPSDDSQALIATVPPGEGYVLIHLDFPGMPRRPGIEIAFRDAANRYWLRQTNGKLVELLTSPEVHYGIPMPAIWGVLREKLP